MGEVVNLAYYRALRAAGIRSAVTAPVKRMTREERLQALANMCRVIDATTGHELAGVPSRDLVDKAGIGNTVRARYSEGEWHFVKDDPAHIDFCRCRGWEVRAVRVERFR